MMGEALSWRATVLGWREQGTGHQDQTIGVLMVRSNGCGGQIGDITADPVHAAVTGQLEAIGTYNRQIKLGRARIIQSERFVEQSDERADGGRPIVVFRLTKQQGAAAFDIAQVDICLLYTSPSPRDS